MKIVFAEPDKMFRLVAAALDPSSADEQFLREFFLTESDDPPALMQKWAARRGVPKGLIVRIAADEAQFGSELHDADVVVLEKQRLTATLLENARSLKLVQTFGRDTSMIDLAACADRGIVVRALDRFTNRQVAEHTVMLMLALTRDLNGSGRALDAPSSLAPSGWAYNWPACANVKGLVGRTIGLVGLGEVGQLVAEYLRPFSVKLVYTKRHRDPALEARLDAEFVDLPTLVARSDVISLHLPSGAASRHLLDAALLSQVKPGVFIVNTARGSVLDETALVDGLRSGRIAGAGLDVFSVEPLSADHPLNGLPNVILTPHVAAGSRDENWLDLDIGPIVDAALAVWRGRSLDKAS